MTKHCSMAAVEQCRSETAVLSLGPGARPVFHGRAGPAMWIGCICPPLCAIDKVVEGLIFE